MLLIAVLSFRLVDSVLWREGPGWCRRIEKDLLVAQIRDSSSSERSAILIGDCVLVERAAQRDCDCLCVRTTWHVICIRQITDDAFYHSVICSGCANSGEHCGATSIELDEVPDFHLTDVTTASVSERIATNHPVVVVERLQIW